MLLIEKLEYPGKQYSSSSGCWSCSHYCLVLLGVPDVSVERLYCSRPNSFVGLELVTTSTTLYSSSSSNGS